MRAAPVVTFSGQPLHTLGDEALLQLLLRDDLPQFLNELYGTEADRRMGKQIRETTEGEDDVRCTG